MLTDITLFPHLADELSLNVLYLYCEILQLREAKTMLLSWDHFVQLASDVGLTGEAVLKAASLLECKVCK